MILIIHLVFKRTISKTTAYERVHESAQGSDPTSTLKSTRRLPVERVAREIEKIRGWLLSNTVWWLCSKAVSLHARIRNRKDAIRFRQYLIRQLKIPLPYRGDCIWSCVASRCEWFSRVYPAADFTKEFHDLSTANGDEWDARFIDSRRNASRNSRW